MKPYFAFQWHITDACDQRCKHCYIFSEDNNKKTESMSFSQMQEVLSNCEDFCRVYRRRPYFYITGGDPILHPDFWRLLRVLKEKEICLPEVGKQGGQYIRRQVGRYLGESDGGLPGLS